MKRIMKKRDWAIVLVALILTAIAVLTVQENREKKIVGYWELVGTCKDNTLLFGDFGEFIYFNLNLTEDGIVNIFSYPEKTSGLGTYYLSEKNSGTYDYMALLYTHRMNKNDKANPLFVKLNYSIKEDQLILFYSEDDGLIFKRTEHITTVDKETVLNNYIGEYVAGEYFKYENYYEKSLNIEYVSDTNIIFDICYQNKYREDNVVATKNEYGYYYFEFSNTYCCGYMLFEGKNVVVDITTGGGVVHDFGKTTYTKINN